MEPLQERYVHKNSTETIYEQRKFFVLPPKLHSLGLLRILMEKSSRFFDYTLANFEFQLAVMFFLTLALNALFKKRGIPPIVQQIITGILFNPITLPHWVSERIFTVESVKTIGTLTALIYQLFIFHSGVKMEVGMIRTVGPKVLASSAACTVIPFFVGVAIFSLMPRSAGSGWFRVLRDIASSNTYSITSFPVLVSILNDLKLVNSELGRLSLSTALVSDLISMVLSLTSLGADVARGDDRAVATQLIVVFCFMFFVVFMLRPTLRLVVGKPSEPKKTKDLHIFVVTSLALSSVFFANYFPMFVHFGPFIVGLAVPAGSSLGASIVNLFDVVQGYFIPFYITVCAMRMDYEALYTFSETLSILTGTILIPSTKFFVSFLLQAYVWKMPPNDAIAFALLMCAKGVVELALYSFFYDNMLISGERYAYMILGVLVSGVIVPVLVKYLYSATKRYENHHKRNLMNADSYSGIRIIACIHATNHCLDLRAVIKLLDASCRGDSPLMIDVLHLIKLFTQSTPVLIAHHKERVVLCDYFYSVNVIRLLNEFEQINQGSATVNAFTAVSPSSGMYDDICTLALDKRASLILLPFHIRWNNQEVIGSESEDKVIRELNMHVLERAPCSIGILVDRYKKLASKEDASLSVYTVAMVFLGGADDREALVFAMNMAKNTKVQLIVVYLTATEGGETDYSMLSHDELDDMEAKRDCVVLQTAKEREYISFKSMVANDAAETSFIIRSMVNEFELMIVGRRSEIKDTTAQTVGLEEWCEYPELGVLGDLILAKDTKGTCSLLVVQQDQYEPGADLSN